MKSWVIKFLHLLKGLKINKNHGYNQKNMKKIVIAGSSSLQDKINYWRQYWQDHGFMILNYPHPIPKETFLEDYPNVYKQFFKDILETDVLFIMNEDKKGVIGHIGAESFGEMCFGVSNNLLQNKDTEIILLKMPEEKVQSYKEINLWLKLGWIKLLK